MFERIRHYVAAGRWIIVNGWWIQPDCNIPSGEAQIRQALYGKRYFLSRFGVEPKVGYNVNSFGHAATFPMLLRHTGSDSYVFMRPGPHEMQLPANLFDWRSPDGSVVPTFRIQGAYNTSPRNTPLALKMEQQLAMSRDAGQPYMCFYGVGNHGGGPTKENIKTINERVGNHADVGFSDPVRYFRELPEATRPVVDTELQFHAIGCYAAASALKGLNRRCEAKLGQAEAAAALAFRVAGTPYPRAAFEALWRKLLFNQFHDTLGGTSLESACIDAIEDFGAILSGAAQILNASVRQLARTIAPAQDPTDATLLLMNFNPADFDGLTEVEPWTDFDAQSPRLLLDDEGRAVPFQYVSPEGKTRGLQRLAFRTAVPGFGYRLLRFVKRADGRPAPSVNFGRPGALNDLTFETDGWRLAIEAESGAIASLVNKKSGASVFSGAAHRGLVIDDPTDTWSHGIDRFGFEGVGTRLEAINWLDDGAVRRTLEIVTSVGASRFATIVVLPQDADLPVDLSVTIDWRERQKLFRIAYPLAGARFEYEIAAGWTERPDDGREVSGQRWVRAVRAGANVTVVNDAKYSYAARDGVLYITALRSPVYSHHDPVKLQEGAVYRYLDQGEHRFTVRIDADGGATRQDAMRLADDLLNPPVSTPQVARGGRAAPLGQWLKAATRHGAVTALKLAEESDALILRAIELDGAPDALRVAGAEVAIRPRGIVAAALSAEGMKALDGLER